MKTVITAIANPIINNELKKEKNIEVIGNDIQYKDGVIEILEKNIEVNYIILSDILIGEELLINLIRKINEIIHEEINYYLDALPYDIEIEEKFIDFFEAEVKYIDEAIDDCMNDNSYSSSLNEYFYGSEDEDKEIELIFARE